MSRAELFEIAEVAAPRIAPREFVETYQRDLLRLAFTLSGSQAVSRYLARDVLIEVLTTTRDDELDPSGWTLLVSALGRHYMAGADPEGNLDEPADDEAGRLRVALELLSRPMRTALVLRDLGGLKPDDVATITGIDPEEFDDVLDWSRERLVEVSDRLSGQPPQRLLASLATEAPRSDLWPDLKPAIEEHERDERRRSRRVVAATLAIFVLLTAVAVIWFLGEIPFPGSDSRAGSGALPDATATPTATTPAIPASPAVVLPPEPTATPAPTPINVKVLGTRLDSDALLHVSLIDDQYRGTGDWHWFSYAPDESSFTRLDTTANGIQNISPDGRWIALLEWQQNEAVRTNDPNAPPQVPVLSVSHDGVLQSWEYEIPYGSSPTSWDTVIAGNHLYLIASTPEPATLTALDLETGEIVVTRTLEVPSLGAELRAGWIPLPEGSWNVDVGLFVIPNASDAELYAHVTLSQYGPEIRNRWTRWLYRIAPTDLSSTFLNTESSTAPSESGDDDTANPDFPFSRARVLPDNSGLFVRDNDGQQLEIVFFDLETGEIERISTSFVALPTSNFNGDYFRTFTSNDGRRLYVYSNLSGEVAVVDLASRTLERTFPLDLKGLRDRPIPVASAHLSPDGERLYLTESMPDDWLATPSSPLPESRPLWVVDLESWQVVHRIDVPGDVRDISIAPDGDQLHALSQVNNPDDPQRWRFVITSFDTQTYEQAEMLELSEIVDQNAFFYLVSLAELYRDTYGRSPIVDGIEAQDVETFATLPRARVQVLDENIPVGVTVPVELEFLDPATGEPLNGEHPAVHFDPEQSVTLAFEQPGAKSVISVSAELAPGQLRGTVKLKSAGSWNARIVVGEGEDAFTLVLQDVFRSTPTYEGDDGRPYALRLETEPDVPTAEGDTTIRASFVDAETGDPLPESVSLVDGLPEEMRVALVGPGSVIRDLPSAGHGIYANTISIANPGFWSARLIFRQPESEDTFATQVEMGGLEVIGE